MPPDSPPLIDVVIPAFRAAGTIERAVRSALAQDGLVGAVIVVVDDGCHETARLARAVDPDRAKAIVNPVNLGAQKSRNAGLAQVGAPHVMFLDSDDYLDPGLLRGLLDAGAYGACDVAFGPWVREFPSGARSEPHVPAPASREEVFRRWLVDRRWTPPCAVLWRTEYIRGIGGWDEAIKRNQDGELVLRALALGASFGFSAAGAGVYVQQDSEHRISRSRTNHLSLLDVANKLVGIDAAIDVRARTEAVSRYLYGVASDAYRRGDPDLGRAALIRSRELGFHGHRGSRVARLGGRVLGVRRYQALAGRLKGAELK